MVARLARRDFWLEKCVSVRCQLFLGVECCATFQAALYIETHLMHQSEFDAANVEYLCHELQIKESRSLIFMVYRHLNVTILCGY